MAPSAQGDPRDRRGPGIWIGLVLGGAVMAYGVVGLLDDASATQPSNLATFVAGSVVVHDALLAPVVAIVAWLLGRLVPAAYRQPVWLALAASGLIVLFSWPLVRGWGRRSANPSLLPLDYGRNLVATLIVIWLVATVDVVRRLVVVRRSRR